MRVSLKRWAARWRRKLVRRGRKRAGFLAACGALALATAWTEPAAATVVHLEVTPTLSMREAYVVYYHNNSSGGIGFVLGSLLAGQTSTFDTDFPDVPLDAFSGPFPGYAVIGVYQQGETSGFSASFPTDSPITEGRSFETLFTARDGFTEGEEIFFLGALGADFAESTVNTFEDILKTPYGTQSTFVNFSTATLGGTALATIPEPSTWVLLVTGAGVVALFARKRPV